MTERALLNCKPQQKSEEKPKGSGYLLRKKLEREEDRRISIQELHEGIRHIYNARHGNRR